MSRFSQIDRDYSTIIYIMICHLWRVRAASDDEMTVTHLSDQPSSLAMLNFIARGTPVNVRKLKRDKPFFRGLWKSEMISFFFFDFARLGHYFDLAPVELFAVPSHSEASGM